MSLGVVREQLDRLFARSPYMHRYFPHCLRKHNFCLFGDDFVTTNHPTFAISTYMLKYFPHILRIR